jgi:hypothetical protein
VHPIEQQPEHHRAFRVRLRSVLSLGHAFDEEDLRGLAALDHTVPYGTVLSRDASQALRARLRSCCPSGTNNRLRAEALIKLAGREDYGRIGLKRLFRGITTLILGYPIPRYH